MPTETGQSADSRHVTSLHWLAHCRLPAPETLQDMRVLHYLNLTLLIVLQVVITGSSRGLGYCTGRPIPAVWR